MKCGAVWSAVYFVREDFLSPASLHEKQFHRKFMDRRKSTENWWHTNSFTVSRNECPSSGKCSSCSESPEAALPKIHTTNNHPHRTVPTAVRPTPLSRREDRHTFQVAWFAYSARFLFWCQLGHLLTRRHVLLFLFFFTNKHTVLGFNSDTYLCSVVAVTLTLVESGHNQI